MDFFPFSPLTILLPQNHYSKLSKKPNFQPRQFNYNFPTTLPYSVSTRHKASMNPAYNRANSPNN